MFIYITQILSPAISIILSISVVQDAGYGLEMLLWGVSSFASCIFYVVPFFNSIFYLLFGIGGDFLLTTIESWVSISSQVLIILDALTIWGLYMGETNPHGLTNGFNTSKLVSFIFQVIQRAFYWERIMFLSPDAIRYIDPTWDEVPSGQYLWPL